MPQTFRYPLETEKYPAKVVFSLIKNPGVQTGKQARNPNQIVSVGTPYPTGDQCTLYLPQSLEYNDAANYVRGELRVDGALVEMALRKSGSVAGTPSAIMNAISGEVKRSSSAILDMLKGNVDPEIAKMVVTKVVAGDATTGAAAGVKSNLRVSTNPNYRTLFSDVPIREFTFGFKMIPTELEETRQIKNIINFFRKELYPTKILQSEGISYGYNFPNTFRIRTFYGDQPIGHKYLDSYLTNVTTRYNGESMAFVRDFEKGGPPEFSDYEMILTFTETRALDQGDIEKGF